MADTETNADLVRRIAAELTSRDAFVTTAESCTGGWLAKTLTDVPGSSGWFEYGFISYGNSAKQDLLSVSAEMLEHSGAVSRETAEQMAVGALKRSGADLAAAVSGIAGPDGGSSDKPVGMVWFAWVWRDRPVFSRMRQFSGERDAVRRKAVREALAGMLETLNRDAGG